MTDKELYYQYKKSSQLLDVWRRFRRNKAAMAGLIAILILALLAVFADVIRDYQRDAIAMNAAIRLQPPSAEHIFGTDDFGRDVFARIIFGARVSLSIGIICVSIALVTGGLIGAVSGYLGGRGDIIVMRVIEVFSCIPGILLALAIVAALGQNMQNLVIAMTISAAPGFARITRALVLPLADQEFVEAARACGTRPFRIIWRHIAPNVMGPMIVQATMAIASVIISAAGLSFIGMGIQPPNPEWGSMLSQGNTFIRNAPHLVIFPGLAIVISALSFNLVGDGLRDALDPRLKD
ncbi:MAG: ABC transporter permease [Oscillospiraceae bacterium]|nr:ABC transporter permease [Oscillospiraceae bacterium]